MKAALTLLYFGIWVCGTINGQAQPLKDILDDLYFDSRPVPTIRWDEFRYVNPVDSSESHFNSFPQQLIRNSLGLFVGINGTGRLYRASRDGHNFKFIRIDSTYYFGHNFRSFIFSYRDTIYSLGGYGFWKINGLLRYFVHQRKEWEIVKLNTEVPVQTENKFDLIWFDQSGGRIYFGFVYNKTQGTKNISDTEIDYTTWVLDLNRKDWTKLGRLHDELKNNLTAITNYGSSPLGQMIGFHKKIVILNYETNSIYELSPLIHERISNSPVSSDPINTVYFKDSTFYLGLMSKGLLDSVVITNTDLINTNKKIFLEPDPLLSDKKSITNVYYGLFALSIILICVLLFIRVKSKKEEEFNKLEAPVGSDTLFTQVETDLLSMIRENSKHAKTTSIEEINKILGVSRKSTDLQKKQRSEIVSSINKKFNFATQNPNQLIQKRRSEFDGRMFEYYIELKDLKSLEELITKGDSSNAKQFGRSLT